MSSEKRENSLEQPQFVTRISERVPLYTGGISFPLPYDAIDKSNLEWFLEIGGKSSFTFPKFKSPGVASYYEMVNSLKEGDQERTIKLLAEVQAGSIKSYDEKSDEEKWGEMAIQIPEWGVSGKRSGELKTALTQRAKGTVLEAMSGFRSHIDQSSEIEEVIAMDYCEEALERYDYPDRKRILFDFERVAQGENISFFNKGEFQTIVVTFGMDYLSNVDPVYTEFNRLLSPQGKLLIMGGTQSGYEDLLKQYFNPEFHQRMMEKAGFSAEIIMLPFLSQSSNMSEYYLVEGTKVEMQ